MKRHQSKSAQEQRWLRKRSNERAFLFTAGGQLLAEVAREQWELAIRFAGGDVGGAAQECGLEALPRDVKALWGRSAAAAWSTYRRWQNGSKA